MGLSGDELLAHLREIFPDRILDSHQQCGDATVVIGREDALEIFQASQAINAQLDNVSRLACANGCSLERFDGLFTNGNTDASHLCSEGFEAR